MGAGPRRIDNAYLEVDRWVRAAVGNALQEFEQLTREEDEVRAQIAELERKLPELQRAQKAAKAEARRAEQDRARSLYESLFDVLGEQSRAIELRAIAVREAEVAGDSELLAELVDDPARAAALQEYLDYKKRVLPGLNAFPDSYRGAVHEHHLAVKAELVAYFEDREPWYPPVRGKDLDVDVLVAVDVPEEDLAVVMAVLPISAEVQLKWSDRHDGLATAFAARCVEGMYRAAIGLGQPEAQVVMGGHRGLLVAEIQLVGDPGELGPAVAGGMQAAIGRGLELQAARVHGQVKVVSVDDVLPPEVFPIDDDEEDGDAG
ncbi:MAG: hypothetical protein EP330_08800 [Deltaproteobacteria bacterium]|nr:MAG: hypothetical protein EP330_08800 [Deltaproteobacteria bacterium]